MYGHKAARTPVPAPGWAMRPPELRGARVLDVRVGLRPTRPRIRVERVAVGDRCLVHNYGHGGGGITLSWGCAREVAALLDPAR